MKHKHTLHVEVLPSEIRTPPVPSGPKIGLSTVNTGPFGAVVISKEHV